MLKREIKYTDFEDNEVTDTFWFHISKSEAIELEVGHKGGMKEFLERVIKTEDHQTLISEFKKLILLAYGEKSPDGKRFIKSDEMREAFSQTAAFDALFMELATSDDAMATFVKGLLPKDMQAEIEKQQKLPPPTTHSQIEPASSND